MKHLLVRSFAFTLVCSAGATHAAAVVDLTARESVTHIVRFGGFAIVSSDGEDGSTAPVTDYSPASLGLGNEHQHSGTYLLWDVSYTQTWTLSQTYAVDPAAHTISGSGSTSLVNVGEVWGTSCTPCAPTMQIDAQNTQVLEFALSAATSYAFHSVNTAAEWVDLLLWSSVTQSWTSVWSGLVTNEDQTWDSSGTLQAGLYRLRNNPYGQHSSGIVPHASAWSYTMTLPDAVITPVPVPAAAWLLGTGLILIRVRRRPR